MLDIKFSPLSAYFFFVLSFGRTFNSFQSDDGRIKDSRWGENDEG